MDVTQYLQIFIEESKEHLQNLNDNLLQLENDPENMNILNEIFRAAHTLKGMSGTMGYNNMQKLNHTMENVLDNIRNGEIHVTSKLIDILFKACDALEKYVDEIISTGKEGTEDNQFLIKSLNGILEDNNNSTESNSQELEQSLNKSINLSLSFNDSEKDAARKMAELGKKLYRIDVSLSQSCMLKSARAYLVVKNIQDFGEIVKANPDIQDIEQEKFAYDLSFVVATSDEKRVFDEEINSISEITKVLVTDFDYEAEENITVISGQESLKTAPRISRSINETNESEDHEDSGHEDKKVVTSKTVRVDIGRLDNLMNLVSELIIVKTRLEEGIKEAGNAEALEYLERVTTNLHDAVMKVRMVPVERVFNRFPRMIRDLAQSLEKNIILKMSGEETELDRTVIDEIGDPLIHLLRNSADHGIETPEERIKIGKPKQGTINLRAYQDGNNVVIEVEDDGNGIDYEKIREKAIERGIITKETSQALSENELLQFIFAPSFSTALKITNVSGRGVGLDVVKTKIEALGGNVEVKSEAGKGTKFMVRLPLTLAIIQSLMVKVGNEKYAIPLNIIQTIEDVKVSDIQHIQKRETIVLRDKVIPIVRLDKELDINKNEETEAPDTITVVIARKGEKETGYVVDSLIGEQEIVIKSLGKYLVAIKMIAGATILGNGEVALILDINMLG